MHIATQEAIDPEPEAHNGHHPDPEDVLDPPELPRTPDEEFDLIEEMYFQQAENGSTPRLPQFVDVSASKRDAAPRPPQPCPVCHKSTTWINRGDHVVCCYCGGKVVCSPP